ncbi:MAG: hypothetical protein ACREXP_26010 [Steroidobacteraceae bacterium]
MTASLRCRIAASIVALVAAQLAHAELPQRAPLQILEPDSTDASNDPENPPSPPFLGLGLAVVGNVALAGMPGAFDERGRVAGFVRDAAGAWIRRQTLIASNLAPAARFGEHIAIFNNRALITSSSAVYIFQLHVHRDPLRRAAEAARQRRAARR